MSDNVNLRLILTALYMIVEALRRRGIGELGCSTAITDSEFHWIKSLQERFQSDLGLPLCGDQSLSVVLFQMVTKFCAGSSPHYPMRKVLLLLWKTLLSWLGGWEELKRAKSEARTAARLSLAEDTLTVSKTMRAAAPPSVLPLMAAAMANDGDGMGMRRGRPPMARRQLACMRSSDSDEKLDSEDDDMVDQIGPGGLEAEAGDDSAFEPPQENLSSTDPGDDANGTPAPSDGAATPRPGSPVETQGHSRSNPGNSGSFVARLPPFKTLPWKPKIRPQEIEAFLDNERSKFFGFQLPEDGMTTAGLPQPIFESLKALKKHVYVSLGEVQAKRDDELNRYCFSQKEETVPECPAEQLYRSILPEIPQHMIALLKILLSAQPSSKAKTDAINILSDLLPLGTDPALTSRVRV